MSPRRRRGIGSQSRLQLAAIWFILPALIIYALFVLYPLIVSLWGSFIHWRGIRPMGFVGLGNFQRLFVFPSWPRFSGAFWHNVAWFAAIMVFQNAVGLVFAYLLFLAQAVRTVPAIGVLLSGSAQPGDRGGAVAAAARAERRWWNGC